MGLTESSLSTILKPFDCLAHCKFTAKSPCCKQCCGDGDDHCICGIDTHQYEDEEEHAIEQVSAISDK